ERRVVRAVDRDLERPREARLVGPGLALQGRDVGAELLPAYGIDPPRRERHEVVRLAGPHDEVARALPVALVNDRMGLHEMGPELEEADGRHGRERPPFTMGSPVGLPLRLPPRFLPCACDRRRPRRAELTRRLSLRHGRRFMVLRGAVRLPAVRPSTIFYGCVAVLASAPAWIVEHPPLEDLPFHMATLRAIHSYSDPAYGFGADFFLNLFHTQYALY